MFRVRLYDSLLMTLKVTQNFELWYNLVRISKYDIGIQIGTQNSIHTEIKTEVQNQTQTEIQTET